jgi:hypothetical protein
MQPARLKLNARLHSCKKPCADIYIYYKKLPKETLDKLMDAHVQ